MNIGNRIKLYRTEKGWKQTELGEKLGITGAGISSWETGRTEPNMGQIERLAEIFGVTKTEFLGLAPNYPLASTDHTHWVPVLGRVAAGIPAEMVEDVLGYEEIDDSIGEAFALRINGDSMAPSLMKGDVVIVKRQEDVESGDVAIVAVNGCDATCKKIVKSSDGVMLVPINPEYPPTFYSNDEILSAPITILGKVVELRRSF